MDQVIHAEKMRAIRMPGLLLLCNFEMGMHVSQRQQTHRRWTKEGSQPPQRREEGSHAARLQWFSRSSPLRVMGTEGIDALKKQAEDFGDGATTKASVSSTMARTSGTVACQEEMPSTSRQRGRGFSQLEWRTRWILTEAREMATSKPASPGIFLLTQEAYGSTRARRS